MNGAGVGGLLGDCRGATGKVSGTGTRQHSAPEPAGPATCTGNTGSLRTRGDLERSIMTAAEPLKVKTELMDTASPGEKIGTDTNFDYNDDEVFCYPNDPATGTDNSRNSSFVKNANFQVRSGNTERITNFLG